MRWFSRKKKNQDKTTSSTSSSAQAAAVAVAVAVAVPVSSTPPAEARTAPRTRELSTQRKGGATAENSKQQPKVASSSSSSSFIPVAATKTTVEKEKEWSIIVNDDDDDGDEDQQLWKLLWETQSPLLVDPVDVPVVCENLMNQMIDNLLSPTELTFVQRKVRNIVHNLDSSSNDETTQAAKTIVRNQRLLNVAIWKRLFDGYNNNNNACGDSGGGEHHHHQSPLPLPLVLDNAYTLLLHLSSESLFRRAAAAAKESAEKAGLELDVNNKTKQQGEGGSFIPPPPPLPQSTFSGTAPTLPAGITLQSLSFLLALALRGNRQQQLQLLFYLCVEDKQSLQEFLATHPAGGVPTFLLEVGQEEKAAAVISLSSLAHYRYHHGLAFLPRSIDEELLLEHPFIASASQSAVTVKAATVQRVVSALLLQDLGENSHRKQPASGKNGTKTTQVMQQIWEAEGSYSYDYSDDDPKWIQSSLHRFKQAGIPDKKDMLTIQDFSIWASKALDDFALDAVMHQLFATGIFPSPVKERELVLQEWSVWQQEQQNGSSRSASATAVWGGLGGLDGRGGLDHGVLYCLDRRWWDDWAAYVGWSWKGDPLPPSDTPKSRQRPGDNLTEGLVECLTTGDIIPGSLGSYEEMKPGLRKNQDYVLIPPGVWNVLYELYGGGPPLPRMVQEAAPSGHSDKGRTTSDEFVLVPRDEQDKSFAEGVMGELRVPRLAGALSVSTHPWIIHCKLCDPGSPYRRGEGGSTAAIQIMAMPEQPLWRLGLELLARFPLHTFKIFDSDNKGKCRLWKHVEDTGPDKKTPSRYGPWILLCGDRGGHISMPASADEGELRYSQLIESWKEYTNTSTVESAGLVNGDQLMFEFAVLNSGNELLWPRNAAARAQGFGDETNPIVPTKKTPVVKSGGVSASPYILPGFGVRGLNNTGNLGWLSCVVQCVSQMPLLRAYFLSAQYKSTGDLNRDNPLGTGGKLLEEFADLLRLLWSSRGGTTTPIRFRALLGEMNGQYSAADQQDAQQFLTYMFDTLHEDSNKVRKKPHVAALEADWVASSSLQRVSDESWRRFLRRNRSIMTDVTTGQVLNTSTCRVCKFASQSFDAFNLLSVPIPVFADVIFQCTVIRRATALNTDWTLNKPRKGDKRTSRFVRKNSTSPPDPPSDFNIAEQYVIAMSRLADSSDLRHQIQKVCGIQGNRLRLCRAENFVVNEAADDKSVVKHQTRITPLTEKEGPCCQLARKPAANEEIAAPTLIIAFENTLRPRPAKAASDDTADEDKEYDAAQEEREIRRQLDAYGDEKECRLFDTDPLDIAKTVSRSLWPRSEDELKLGLRVDARDKRGNWYHGSIIEIIEEDLGGIDSDTGVKVPQKKKVLVHFDNFSTKWDETYSIEHFEEGRVRPLYSHAVPKPKPTEFHVFQRHNDRKTGNPVIFGLSFYVQCHNEWSNARAGAQILAQASRFLQQNSDLGSPIDLDDPAAVDRESRAQRLYDKTQSAISDLIDVLVDCDREYVRLSLGVSAEGEEGQQRFRNPSFDGTTLSAAFSKKVSVLLRRLPFDVRVATVDAAHGGKPSDDEVCFPFNLIGTIGNFMHARHVIILQWREPPPDKKSAVPTNYLNSPVMYVPPKAEVDKASLEILKNSNKDNKEKAKWSRPGSVGIDLGVCLTEFCKVQKLSMSDNWRCPRCKDCCEGERALKLARLPDVLTIQLRRFNMSARWREKITMKVNFPMTGLDLSQWFHEELTLSEGSNVYDLIGVMNHFGRMYGGQYVAYCKPTLCGKEGKEEVSYSFNGAGTNSLEILNGSEEMKETVSMAQSAAQSAEPLWLEFEDDLVQHIPSHKVVSEQAYLLIYRRRRISPSSIAMYSTLE